MDREQQIEGILRILDDDLCGYMKRFEIQHTDGHWSVIEGFDEQHAIQSELEDESGLHDIKPETIRPLPYEPRIVEYVTALGAVYEIWDDGQEIEIASNFSRPEQADEMAAALNKRLLSDSSE